MNSRTIGIGAFIIYASLIGFTVYGWIANIISLTGMDWDVAVGIEGILRIIGIVVVPLGVVMGIFV